MIGPRQKALIEAARDRLQLDADKFAADLREAGGVERIEQLSAEGYERVLDRFTARGFVDRRRPILSAWTRDTLAALFEKYSVTQFRITTLLREVGAGGLKTLDGKGFLLVLSWLERMYGCPADVLIKERRAITPAQIRLVQVARKTTRIPEKSYSRVLQELGGVNSAADLDGRGFDLVMAEMSLWGFERDKPATAADEAGLGRRPGFASPEQLALIRALWAEWSGAGDEAALNAWLERYQGTTHLRFLTAAKASKAITALKAMKARGRAKLPESA